MTEILNMFALAVEQESTEPANRFSTVRGTHDVEKSAGGLLAENRSVEIVETKIDTLSRLTKPDSLPIIHLDDDEFSGNRQVCRNKCAREVGGVSKPL
jgi:hypothetical protein